MKAGYTFVVGEADIIFKCSSDFDNRALYFDDDDYDDDKDNDDNNNNQRSK